MYVTKFIDNVKYRQGSVMNYVLYLEKERLVQEHLDSTSSRELSAYLDKQNDVVRAEGQEYFFNGSGSTFDSEDVTKAIDANVKGLKKSEARYYTFAISPSAQEITHLRRLIADTKQAMLDSGELVPETFDDDLMRGYLKEYAVQCMDTYARNFGHPKIRDNRDLLWFGMVEKDRYWKSQDKEVRTNARIQKQIAALRVQSEQGKAVSDKIAVLEKRLIREYDVRPGGSREILAPMMPKSGDNWHVHISVSRRDITNTFNLSPNANGRGSKKHVLNGQSVRVGFDREAFKIACERNFDRLFVHSRLATESYEQAKRLRKEGAFVYARQLAKDRAIRHQEARAFRQLRFAGYQDYYSDLLQRERLDGRQLLQLKGYLARRIHACTPTKSVDRLINLDLEELRSELAGLDREPTVSPSYLTQNVAARIGDKTLEISGLQGYHPVTTAYRQLRRGIRMREAFDQHREAVDRWIDIYSDRWYRENYRFVSIAAMQRMDTLQAQAAFLNSELGESVLLASAQEYANELERQLVGEFLRTAWPEWKQDTIRSYAQALFGRDASAVRSSKEFETLVRERLLPVEAQQRIDTLAGFCKIEKFESLQARIAELQPQTASGLTARLQTFLTEQGQPLQALKSVLSDRSVSALEKERRILRLALDDKSLYRALRNWKAGLLNGLERRNPAMKYAQLQQETNRLLGELKAIGDERKTAFDRAIRDFLHRRMPDYAPIIEKQTQLERLIEALSPSAEEYPERLAEANRAIARALSPRAERIFEKEGQRLFGPDTHWKNETDFLKYIESHFAPERAATYRPVLNRIFSEIEEERRTVIRHYADRLFADTEGYRVDSIRLQQGSVNRFIDRKYAPKEAKRYKEDLQRAVAAVCRHPVLQETEYKVFDLATQKRIAVRAAAKVGPVRLPVSPPMLALKTVSKLFKLLINGY